MEKEQVQHEGAGNRLEQLHRYKEYDIVNEVIKRPPIPKLPKDYEIDPLVESLSGCIPMPPQIVIDSDPRLAYILSK